MQVIDHTPELRPVAMEIVCCMVTQLGQRYKIFIPIVKKVCMLIVSSVVSVCVCVVSDYVYACSVITMNIVRIMSHV